jgi:hypothetical protein
LVPPLLLTTTLVTVSFGAMSLLVIVQVSLDVAGVQGDRPVRGAIAASVAVCAGPFRA